MCRFIDYEYAGFNPIALDIANHWCEYAADYHTAEPHLLDFTRFPGDKQQKLFTRAYVRAVIALKQQKEDMVGLFILDLDMSFQACTFTMPRDFIQLYHTLHLSLVKQIFLET